MPSSDGAPSSLSAAARTGWALGQKKGVTGRSRRATPCVDGRTRRLLLNLVRAGPRLLKLVQVAPRPLKLVQASHSLITLARASPLIVGGYSSGAALVNSFSGKTLAEDIYSVA